MDLIEKIADKVIPMERELIIRFDYEKSEYLIHCFESDPYRRLFKMWTPDLIYGLKQLEAKIYENKCVE